MRLENILAAVNSAIVNGEQTVQLGKKTFRLNPTPGDCVIVMIPTKDGEISIESTSPHERTLVGQATKNFGHTVLRVRRNGVLGLDGSVDGIYSKDVEFECTKLVLQETA